MNNNLMWDETKIPEDCTCPYIANKYGYTVVISKDCPVHSKYLKTWKEGMCIVINRSVREVSNENA